MGPYRSFGESLSNKRWSYWKNERYYKKYEKGFEGNSICHELDPIHVFETRLKNDPIERMKYLFAFAISGVHQGPMICRSRAPFNPILGETYQAVNEKDGSRLYLEQTEHHPPTFNFSVIGPNKHFEYNGFGTIDAHLTNINIIKGERIGKTILKFDDGSLFTFTTLKTRINGIIMGDRIYNYYGDLIIKDYKNKVECIMTLNDEIQEGNNDEQNYIEVNLFDFEIPKDNDSFLYFIFNEEIKNRYKIINK